VIGLVNKLELIVILLLTFIYIFFYALKEKHMQIAIHCYYLLEGYWFSAVTVFILFFGAQSQDLLVWFGLALQATVKRKHVNIIKTLDRLLVTIFFNNI